MKKILALALTLALTIVPLASCSGDGSGSGGNAGSGGQGTGTGSSDTIVIGGINDLTGNRSVTGNAINNGVTLAIEEINAKGGVLGKQIKYVIYDIIL